ncbi:hypothetical protein PENTCL1PPCAC_10095 [Pristionchus entomophagus]|uniref:Uncharacterized protein n=1 Tax=Pristionchus entomophagus TaxID=358040 RepID=A0AAV5SXN6_9BILA|nr:hypothetical protein PENTCL1PPCAC_10095 [Pristionchus entomophagus]
MLIYSVDMMGTLPKDEQFMPVPSSYDLPYMRILYATVEFAHHRNDDLSLNERLEQNAWRERAYIRNFHIHSF